eukprot:2675961-Rhodomonas_salina.1
MQHASTGHGIPRASLLQYRVAAYSSTARQLTPVPRGSLLQYRVAACIGTTTYVELAQPKQAPPPKTVPCKSVLHTPPLLAKDPPHYDPLADQHERSSKPERSGSRVSGLGSRVWGLGSRV